MTTDEFGAFVLRCNHAIRHGEPKFTFQGNTWSTEFKYVLACMAEKHNIQAHIGKDGEINIKRLSR